MQSSADFALIYNFQGTHMLGASHGHLCDSSAFLFSMSSLSFLHNKPFVFIVFQLPSNEIQTCRKW